jgi:hypothetical protein
VQFVLFTEITLQVNEYGLPMELYVDYLGTLLRCQNLDSTVSNGRMTDEMERIWKEAAVA